MTTSPLPLFVLFILFSGTTSAQIKLPQIIGDGLVLQREQNIRIWARGASRAIDYYKTYPNVDASRFFEKQIQDDD